MKNKKLFSALMPLFICVVLLAILQYSSAESITTNRELVINEVLTKNTVKFLGESGQHYSWIELKNVTDSVYDLSGCYLSNDLLEPLKWELPHIQLYPGQIITIYTSGEDRKTGGEYHANFILQTDEQNILVSNKNKTIAKVKIPKLKDNISYGRRSDFTYVYYIADTPGEENSGVSFTTMADMGTVLSEDFPVRINEISPAKQSSIYDEDGFFYDFIELYNASDKDVDISGFFISDRENAPTKGKIKSAIIPAKGYLVIFASGKNSSDGGFIHLPFKLSSGEVLILCDDRGTLIDKVSIPAVGDNISYGRGLEDENKWFFYSSPTPGYENSTLPSLTNLDAAKTRGSNVLITEILSSNSKYAKDAYGKYEDYIELYNPTEADISLSGWYLSDSIKNPKKWAFDSNAKIKAGGYMLVFASGRNTIDKKGYRHTSFKLNKENEWVVLSKGDVLSDKIKYGMMKNNVSLGFSDPRVNEVSFFSSPTPKAANAGSTYSGFTAPVNINMPSGVYKSSITVELSCAQSDVKIYYTTDASKPTSKSKVYSEPIKVSKNSSIRAIAVRAQSQTSEVATANYLFNVDHHGLPIVILTTNNKSLFDGGIYNSRLRDRRRVETNIELIEPDGTVGFSETALIRKHGNMSVFEPQKSFAVYFRESVGKSELNYDLFPDEDDGVTTFRSFILRTSGNDWDDLKCKDGYVAALVKDEMDVDYQSYRPAVLYINGKYWGIYNIRDQQNEDYLASHHGVDPDNVDIISFGHGVHEGSYKEYNKLLDFLKNKDLNNKANWEKVESMMDVDNMIDTYLCHIYFGNFDTVNIKWWRERKEGAKWRWMLYDLDYAFYIPRQNNLKIVTNPAGHGVNNYFSSTLMYNLMKSKYFKARFQERLSKHWKTIFNADYMLDKFEEVFAKIEPEMPAQLKRWSISLSHLKAEVAEFDDYVRRRPDIFRQHVKSYFKLTNAELDKLLPKQKITHKKLKVNTSLF